MADAAQPAKTRPKKGVSPMILGLGLALSLAGAGFYATFNGLVSLDSDLFARNGATGPEGDAGGFEYVAVTPITINLGGRGDSRHLRFSAQVETAPGAAAQVSHLMPRILDVLNIYLRALDAHELEDPAALIRLRGQMLRRIQVVAGPGLVNDLLITEFVFN